MDQYITLLKQFVGACKANPDMLHDPKFAFYREFLESLGATIPEKSAAPAPEAKPEPTAPKEEKAATPEPEIPKPDAIPFPEIDNSGVIEPESADPLPMGDSSKEATEEELEKASEERDKATEAFSNGDFAAALQHFTAAIENNPGSAILHAKRANVLLKLKRPIGAIADCDKAISINPDSAQGYKFRGRANGLLGKWVEAKTDLATACKLDYDDTANEWLKEVEPNAHKIQEYNRAVERQKAEIELAERRERVRKAQEANRKAAEEAAKHEEEDFDFSSFGGGRGPPGGGMPGMGGMGEMFNDPEIAAALSDPEVLPALMDIFQNPANMMKYINNPKIASIIQKLQQKGGGMPGFASGPSAGGCPNSGCSDPHCDDSAPAPPPPQQPTSKAPEPDLD